MHAVPPGAGKMKERQERRRKPHQSSSPASWRDMRLQGREKRCRQYMWKPMVMKTAGMSSGMYGNFLMPATRGAMRTWREAPLEHEDREVTASAPPMRDDGATVTAI